jgi:NhaP-type Na+/H+ or K+/H+ antiporter
MIFPHNDISFDGNWFLRILVPPIVFEAALGIDKRSFNRHLVPIFMYAVGGTLVATVLTAMIVHRGSLLFPAWCSPIPYVEALTFGALISSIDPIAVLSVLSNMGMTDTDTIYVVIFGESLLNDGVAIVLFETLVHFLDENLVIDGEAIFAASIHFLVVAFGSLLVGVGSGMLSTVYYWLFHGCQTALVEVLMFFCWALLPYYVCDGIGWSGIVSAVATGFVMDLYVVGEKAEEMDHSEHSKSDQELELHWEKESKSESGRSGIFSGEGHLSEKSRTHIGFVTEMISTAMETAIFAYLGLFLFSHRYHWNFFTTVIAIVACCISRAVMIPTLSLLANAITRIQQTRAACRNRGSAAKRAVPNAPAGVVIDRKMQIVLWFAGLRGAVSFALVERIGLYDSTTGEGTRLKPELKAMTSATIMFTVFVLGGYTYYVRYLHTLSKRDCFCFLYSVLCSAITDHQSLTLCSRVFFVFSTNR